MTREEMQAVFEKHEDEFLKFDRVSEGYRLSRRPDLCAFLLLDRLVPGTNDIVSAAEHDEFWIEVSPDDFAEAATEADIVTLVRCGLRYDDGVESFAFFT